MQPNPYTERQGEAEGIYHHVNHLALLAGITQCTEQHAQLDSIAATMVGRVLFSTIAHADSADNEPLQPVREVLWEIGNLISHHTVDNADVIDMMPATAGITLDLHRAAVHAFMECSVRDDLVSAMRVVDAIATEHDQHRAFTECMTLSVNLVMSLGSSFHYAMESRDDS